MTTTAAPSFRLPMCSSTHAVTTMAQRKWQRWRPQRLPLHCSRSQRAAAPMQTTTTTARQLDMPFHHSASADNLEMTTMTVTPPFHSHRAAAPTPLATTSLGATTRMALPATAFTVCLPTQAAPHRLFPLLRHSDDDIVFIELCSYFVIDNLMYFITSPMCERE